MTQTLASTCCGDKFSALSLITSVRLSFLTIVFIQLFTSIGQFMVMLSTTTFLTRACGLNDTMAGIIYGIYGMAAFFWSMLGGPIIDRIGFKPVLILATVVGTVGRILTASTANTGGIYFTIPALLAWGDSWISLGLTTATYAYVRNRGLRKIMFGINYSIMNVGAVIAAAIFESKLQLTNLKVIMNVVDIGSQSIMFMAALPVMLSVFISILMPAVPIRTRPATSQQHELNQPSEESDSDEIDAHTRVKQRESKHNPDSPVLTTLMVGGDNESSASSTGDIKMPPFCQSEWIVTLMSDDFWRVAIFSISCIGARTVFLHLNATFPTYMHRLYGNDAPIGAMYAINPLIIMALAPLTQIIIAKFDTLKFLIIGTSLSAVSPLLLAFAAPNELGLLAIILFAVILSLGEALWGPLSQFYISQVAGERRLGTFMSLLTIVTFVPKLPTGVLSGFLLSKYCPSDMSGPCQRHTLWFIITAISITTPLFLILFTVAKVFRKVDNEQSSPSLAPRSSLATPQIGQQIQRNQSEDDLDRYYKPSSSSSPFPEESKQHNQSSRHKRRHSTSAGSFTLPRRNPSPSSAHSSVQNSPRVSLDSTADTRLTRMKRASSSSSLVFGDMSDVEEM